ncbi:helix-turn-helix transcriptional regulator [Photorhabdus antumapuensis]|nr:helix-turn-helix transcriptional regulator [Photorhabdus antumapuensis]
MSRLEKGNGNPTLKTLLNYAKACNCELHFGFKTT